MASRTFCFQASVSMMSAALQKIEWRAHGDNASQVGKARCAELTASKQSAEDAAAEVVTGLPENVFRITKVEPVLEARWAPLI